MSRNPPATFICIDNIVQSHGIPEEVIDNTINGAKEFFALPDGAKMEVGSI
jgi:isopenicillin N synthase-like dioxygenase